MTKDGPSTAEKERRKVGKAEVGRSRHRVSHSDQRPDAVASAGAGHEVFYCCAMI